MTGRCPREKWKEWRKKCGDLFCFYFGPSLFVVVNGYELQREFFVKHADVFSDRPDRFLSIPGYKKKGILLTCGPEGEEQKAVTLSILKSFGMGKNILEERIKKEVSLYMKALADLNGRAHDVQNLTKKAVSNVIFSILLNHRYEYNDEFFSQPPELVGESILVSGFKEMVFDVVPFLKYLPGDILKRKKFNESIDLKASYISERFIKEELEADPNEKREPSFIRSYLDEMNKRQASGEHTSLDHDNLRRIVWELYDPGYATLTHTLAWYMVFMVNYPEINRKVCMAIEDVVGSNRQPTLEDMPKLNYVNAVIMETQRRASVFPQSSQRECSKTVTIQGYTIPKGATVIPNLDSVLLDEKIWGDPQNFRPERFLADDGSLLQPDEFIPYSLGRRKCLAADLANMVLFLFVTSLSQTFLLISESDTPPSMDFMSFNLSQPKPFRLHFVNAPRSTLS